MTMSDPVRIGFLGAGRMATALARGLINSHFVTAKDVVAADVSETAREAFTSETGADSLETNLDVVKQSEVVVLAVKPHIVESVLGEISGGVDAERLLVSIAAGVPIARLSAGLPAGCRIVRVMPNTPCLVGAGASGFAMSDAATEDDGRLVAAMFETVGIAIELPESLLDAVTGLSGSGPAFAYQMIEALSDGGVRMGLPRDAATRLAAQTLLGAARMVLETGEHPGALKDAVTSPGGTTIAGLHALERGGLRGCLMNAVEAATNRSRELGSA